jgi:hypothetical protein
LDKTPVQPQTNDQEASQEQESEDVKKAVSMKELPLAPANNSLNLGQHNGEGVHGGRPPDQDYL